MKVVLDVTRLIRRLIKKQTLTGIDRVTLAYVQHYQPVAQALVRWGGRSWILSDKASQALFEWINAPNSITAVRWIIIKGILSYRFNSMRSTYHRPTYLINTGHIGLSQSDYSRFIHQLGVKPIFFVHDLIPLTHPEYCSAGEDERHRAKMNYVLKQASGVITNSQATLSDLKQYADQTNQIMPRATAALLGSGVIATASSKNVLVPKPYFVILSTIEPRKNHLLLLQIWRDLYQRFAEDTPKLLVIGKRGWECENVVDLLDRSMLLRQSVVEISSCSDTNLVTYLQQCQALLFPSFVEGYGLPLVEALSLGVPVIASDLPVFREIAGDVPTYINPLDGKQWQELILDYAKPDSQHRALQMQRLQSYQAPTWAAHFRTVDSFLKM